MDIFKSSSIDWQSNYLAIVVQLISGFAAYSSTTKSCRDPISPLRFVRSRVGPIWALRREPCWKPRKYVSRSTQDSTRHQVWGSRSGKVDRVGEIWARPQAMRTPVSRHPLSNRLTKTTAGEGAIGGHDLAHGASDLRLAAADSEAARRGSLLCTGIAFIAKPRCCFRDIYAEMTLFSNFQLEDISMPFGLPSVVVLVLVSLLLGMIIKAVGPCFTGPTRTSLLIRI